MTVKRLLAIWLALPLLVFSACDSTNPVAPDPDDPQPPATGNFNVTLTASPEEIQAGTNQASTLTVEVTRTSDNLPPADGTSVAVNTSLGSLGVNDEQNPVRSTTLSLTGGRAQVSLFPGPETGTATVLAQAGENTATLSVSILETLPSGFFLSALIPNTGSPDGGEPVVVQGSGFRAPVRVTFGGVQATVVEVSDTEVRVDTPPSPQPVEAGGSLPVDVAVTNDLGSGDPGMDTLAGGFTYSRASPQPVFISSVDPPTGSAAGGDTVNVRGSGFQAPVQVSFGDVQASVRVVTSTAIQVVTPAAPQPVDPGGSLAVDVTVQNALGSPTSSSTTLVGGFTYTEDAPDPLVISSLDPSEGPLDGGTRVTVTGSGFTPGSPVSVELAGVRQRAETVVDATTLEFTTAGADPPDPCPADGRLVQRNMTVTLLDSGLSASSGLTFTYLLNAPQVSRVSPATSSQFGSTVVVEGSGFGEDGAVIVEVDLVTDDGQVLSAEVRRASPTEITIRTPAVPDTFFPEEDCVTEVTTQGKRYLERTVDVRVTNLDNGCVDVFGGRLTYRPSDTRCRETAPP